MKQADEQLESLEKQLPQRTASTTPWLSPILLALITGINRFWGWRLNIDFGDQPRGVVILEPHTSYWDFVVGMLAIITTKRRILWLAKHTAFRWPFGGVMRWLGGVPVDRDHSEQRVERIAEYLRNQRSCLLLITPTGTRKKVRWKTGFYHIAMLAQAPLFLARVDGVDKTLHCSEIFPLSGDLDRDLPLIQARFEGLRGIQGSRRQRRIKRQEQRRKKRQAAN